MTTRTDTSLAALLLAQQLVATPAAPLKSTEYWALLDRVADPAVLLGLDAGGIARVTGVDVAQAERLARLLDAATSVAFRLDEVEQSGLRVVAAVDDGYPRVLVDRLGRAAPPVLYLVGDAALLDRAHLGVVGSRDVTAAGAEVARAAATGAVARDLGVVSGGAGGVDRVALAAALAAGGTAVGMLAGALTRTAHDPEVRAAVRAGRLCLCTPYKPTAAFSVAAAMGRNKLVYALSTRTLVVAAAAGTGGTWAGAAEALRRGTTPVLVWAGDGAAAGNLQLAGRGATGVRRVTDVFARHPPRGTSASATAAARGGGSGSGGLSPQLTLGF